MSKSVAAPDDSSSFVCYNPHCMARNKFFVTEKAFTMHFQRAPQCLAFLRRQRADAAKPAGITRIDATLDPAVFTSSKRPRQMRGFVINDIATLPNVSFPEDESDNYNPDNACFDDMNDIQVLGDASDDDEEFLPPPACTVRESSSSSSSQFMFSTDQKWTIALLKLLDDMNAPDYAFASVLTWARMASADGYSFYPVGGQSWIDNIDIMFKCVHNAQRLLPSVVTVDVPHGPPCEVITYEFAPQLLYLLQNPSIMTQANLLLDLDNPLAPYRSPDGVLGDAISGSVYRDAYKRLITKPTRQLFVPIIQWIDRTTVTGNGRFSLKPYMFTPAIFNETFRRKIQAWGYHGFLPKPKLSAAQNRGMKLGDNVRNYHAQLYAVLTSFTQAGPSLTNVELPIGPQGSMMQVDIVTCILFVIQDMQEGDTLCGRYGVHTPGIQRHSRSCDVDHINLDNPDFTCTFLNAVDVANIARNPSIAVRKRWSQHELNNVFDHVPMADPVRGIYGATPVETMHAFRKGMIEKVTLVVLQNVPASKLAALDALAIRFHKSHRQTVRKQYPATDFSQGITNLTKISAAERLGLVFLFVILSQYDEGWAILHSVFNTKPAESMDSDSDKEEEEPINLADVIEVFEAMLCFDQWLNQPTFWTALNHAESKARVHDSISTLMHLCVTHIPLSKHKTTWKFPKFHELLHILDNMERFGAPINYCAQRPESLLIPAAKKPGRRAQKRHDGSRFELQSAQRLSYSMMINAVHARIWKTTSPVSESMLSTTSKNCTTGRATFATLTHDFTSGFQCYWHSETHAALLRLDNALMQNVYHHFGSNVRLATEIVCNDTTYRCHPSFQSGGPIYDWMRMTVKHKDKNVDGTSKFSTHPCRLVAVVITSNPQPYRLVVQRASHVTGIASVLFTEWEMSYEYEVFEPSCVEGASFVISITENSSKVLETRPRHLWASQFTEPVDHPVKPPVKKPTRPVQRG